MIVLNNKLRFRPTMTWWFCGADVLSFLAAPEAQKNMLADFDEKSESNGTACLWRKMTKPTIARVGARKLVDTLSVYTKQ